jgi:cation transporter-like permease
MSDEELLDVEGELAPFLILLIGAVASAVAAGGGTAVHQNWFDEDYGIDGDDWGQIASNVVNTFTAGFVGGCTRSCTHSVFGPTFIP